MGEEVTKERLSLTADELVDIKQYRLVKAFARVRLELKFFPKPVEVLERLPLELYRPDTDERSPERPVN
jgi:hypothetical protein